MASEKKSAADLEGVAGLGELVQYQPGAVVSRAILKRPVGNVTAFAFDEGEGLSEHTAAFDALVIVTEGAADVMVAGSWQRVAAGQLLRLPANQPHALKAVQRFKMLLVMIRG